MYESVAWLTMSVVALVLALAGCQSAPKKAGVEITQPPIANTQPQPQPQPQPQSTLSVAGPTLIGYFEHPDLTEISGLAVSTRDDHTLWAVNDSGNAAYLYANKLDGEFIRRWRVKARNRDWEDLAAVALHGDNYLLIADIGDNLQDKAEHEIVVIAEPELSLNDSTVVNPVHTIRFRYPQGSHNAESLAVSGNWVYILSKERARNGKRQASRVYRLPFDLTDNGITYVAQLLAEIPLPKQTLEGKLAVSFTGYDLFQPTGLDFDANQRHAYFVSYRGVHRITRNVKDTWENAFAEPSLKIHSHALQQSEAVAVTSNGTVLISSEKRPAPIWALPAATELINN
jgi:hypothetical protein